MNNNRPSSRNTVLSAVAAIGGLVIMVIVAALLYLPDRADTVARPGLSPEERREILEEKRNRDSEELGQYGWIDEASGRIRVPIEHAMQLAVDEITGTGAIAIRQFDDPEPEEPDGEESGEPADSDEDEAPDEDEESEVDDEENSDGAEEESENNSSGE